MTGVSDRPRATPLARRQAARGEQVTNRRHRNTVVDGLDLVVLRHLDGTRDHAALVAGRLSLVVR